MELVPVTVWRLTPLVVTAALLIAPMTTVRAQTGGSVPVRVSVSSSATASGSFVPGAELTTFRIPASATLNGVPATIARAPRAAIARYEELIQGEVPGIPAEVGIRMLQLAAGGKHAGVVRDAVAVAMSTGAGAPSAGLIEGFLEQFEKILPNPSPKRIRAASVAYEALLRGATAAYLAKPPAEVQAAPVILQALVDATAR